MAVTTTYDFSFLRALDPQLITGNSDATTLAGGGVAVSGDHVGHIDTTIFTPNGDILALSNVHTGVNSAIAQLSNGNIVDVGVDATNVFFTITDTAGALVVP